MPEDYYRTLNVPPEASADEIQRAYRALARRYHPDLNPLPAAATLMTVINQAYEILSEPAKRSVYDRKKNAVRDSSIDDAVLLAARNTLLKQGWKATEIAFGELSLKNGSRQVRIHLASFLDPALLRQSAKRSEGLCVVLAVRIDSGLKNVNESTVVIDLMRSRLHLGSFPDDVYESLFRAFL